MKKTFILFLLCALGMYAQAQIVNHDCANVFITNRVLCGDATFTTDNMNGSGVNDFGTQFQNNSGCLLNGTTGTPEVQSAWYAFKIKTSGTLIFDILPLGNDDYDFAVFGANKTCASLGTPIRCSYASNKPPFGAQTGLNLTEGDVTEPAAGNGYVKFLNVQAGELYYLLINNWSNNSSGFMIDFGGTATLDCQVAFLSSTVQCNKVVFNMLTSTNNNQDQISYQWNFGDGLPATYLNTQASPTYYYANAGTYTATCTTQFSNSGVTQTQSISVTVDANTNIPTAVDFAGLNDAYCVNDLPTNLVGVWAGGSPTGGTMNFKVINGNNNQITQNATTFNPSSLGVGTHFVHVTYNTSNTVGCGIQKIKTVVVQPIPTVSFNTTLPAEVCLETNPLDLNAAVLNTAPTGGQLVFDITLPNNVVLTNQTAFNPNFVGNYTITAKYTNVTSGCTAQASKIILVKEKPTPVFVNLADSYANTTPSFALGANPTGGTFQINGTNATQFNAIALGIGIHQVAYTYTAVNGCTATISKQVMVTAPPPSALQVTPVFPFAMNIQWADVAGETGYVVERSNTQGAGYQTVGTTNANVTTFTDNNLTTGQTYFYIVRSTNGNIISANSNEASAIATSIENTLLNEQTTISPNPTQDVCTISFPTSLQGKIHITVYNNTGKSVRYFQQELLGKSVRLDLNALSKGSYNVFIQTKEGNVWKKIVLF